jgi:hypothetical protein
MATLDPSYFDRLIEPVARCFSPEVAQRLLSLPADPAIQSRVAELAAKANEGQLTEAERADYEEYVDAVDMIGVLQARARSALNAPE